MGYSNEDAIQANNFDEIEPNSSGRKIKEMQVNYLGSSKEDKLNLKLKPTMMDDTTATKNKIQNYINNLESPKNNKPTTLQR